MNRNDPLNEPKLDPVLSAFFKAQLPGTWTAPKTVPSRPTPASRLPEHRAEKVLTAPRISLAVSVALLLGGCWFLSERVTDAPVPSKIGLRDGSATTKDPHKLRPTKDGVLIKPMP